MVLKGALGLELTSPEDVSSSKRGGTVLGAFAAPKVSTATYDILRRLANGLDRKPLDEAVEQESTKVVAAAPHVALTDKFGYVGALRTAHQHLNQAYTLFHGVHTTLSQTPGPFATNSGDTIGPVILGAADPLGLGKALATIHERLFEPDAVATCQISGSHPDLNRIATVGVLGSPFLPVPSSTLPPRLAAEAVALPLRKAALVVHRPSLPLPRLVTGRLRESPISLRLQTTLASSLAVGAVPIVQMLRFVEVAVLADAHRANAAAAAAVAAAAVRSSRKSKSRSRSPNAGQLTSGLLAMQSPIRRHSFLGAQQRGAVEPSADGGGGRGGSGSVTGLAGGSMIVGHGGAHGSGMFGDGGSVLIEKGASDRFPRVAGGGGYGSAGGVVLPPIPAHPYAGSGTIEEGSVVIESQAASPLSSPRAGAGTRASETEVGMSPSYTLPVHHEGSVIDLAAQHNTELQETRRGGASPGGASLALSPMMASVVTNASILPSARRRRHAAQVAAAAAAVKAVEVPASMDEIAKRVVTRTPIPLLHTLGDTVRAAIADLDTDFVFEGQMRALGTAALEVGIMFVEVPPPLDSSKSIISAATSHDGGMIPPPAAQNENVMSPGGGDGGPSADAVIPGDAESPAGREVAMNAVAASSIDTGPAVSRIEVSAAAARSVASTPAQSAGGLPSVGSAFLSGGVMTSTVPSPVLLSSQAAADGFAKRAPPGLRMDGASFSSVTLTTPTLTKPGISFGQASPAQGTALRPVVASSVPPPDVNGSVGSPSAAVDPSLFTSRVVVCSMKTLQEDLEAAQVSLHDPSVYILVLDMDEIDHGGAAVVEDHVDDTAFDVASGVWSPRSTESPSNPRLTKISPGLKKLMVAGAADNITPLPTRDELKAIVAAGPKGRDRALAAVADEKKDDAAALCDHTLSFAWERRVGTPTLAYERVVTDAWVSVIGPLAATQWHAITAPASTLVASADFAQASVNSAGHPSARDAGVAGSPSGSPTSRLRQSGPLDSLHGSPRSIHNPARSSFADSAPRSGFASWVGSEAGLAGGAALVDIAGRTESLQFMPGNACTAAARTSALARVRHPPPALLLLRGLAALAPPEDAAASFAYAGPPLPTTLSTTPSPSAQRVAVSVLKESHRRQSLQLAATGPLSVVEFLAAQKAAASGSGAPSPAAVAAVSSSPPSRRRSAETEPVRSRARSVTGAYGPRGALMIDIPPPPPLLCGLAEELLRLRGEYFASSSRVLASGVLMASVGSRGSKGGGLRQPRRSDNGLVAAEVAVQSVDSMAPPVQDVSDGDNVEHPDTAPPKPDPVVDSGHAVGVRSGPTVGSSTGMWDSGVAILMTSPSVSDIPVFPRVVNKDDAAASSFTVSHSDGEGARPSSAHPPVVPAAPQTLLHSPTPDPLGHLPPAAAASLRRRVVFAHSRTILGGALHWQLSRASHVLQQRKAAAGEAAATQGGPAAATSSGAQAASSSQRGSSPLPGRSSSSKPLTPQTYLECADPRALADASTSVGAPSVADLHGWLVRAVAGKLPPQVDAADPADLFEACEMSSRRWRDSGMAGVNRFFRTIAEDQGALVLRKLAHRMSCISYRLTESLEVAAVAFSDEQAVLLKHVEALRQEIKSVENRLGLVVANALRIEEILDGELCSAVHRFWLQTFEYLESILSGGGYEVVPSRLSCFVQVLQRSYEQVVAVAHRTYKDEAFLREIIRREEAKGKVASDVVKTKREEVFAKAREARSSVAAAFSREVGGFLRSELKLFLPALLSHMTGRVRSFVRLIDDAVADTLADARTLLDEKFNLSAETETLMLSTKIFLPDSVAVGNVLSSLCDYMTTAIAAVMGSPLRPSAARRMLGLEASGAKLPDSPLDPVRYWARHSGGTGGGEHSAPLYVNGGTPHGLFRLRPFVVERVSFGQRERGGGPGIFLARGGAGVQPQYDTLSATPRSPDVARRTTLAAAALGTGSNVPEWMQRGRHDAEGLAVVAAARGGDLTAAAAALSHDVDDPHGTLRSISTLQSLHGIGGGAGVPVGPRSVHHMYGTAASEGYGSAVGSGQRRSSALYGDASSPRAGGDSLSVSGKGPSGLSPRADRRRLTVAGGPHSPVAPRRGSVSDNAFHGFVDADGNDSSQGGRGTGGGARTATSSVLSKEVDEVGDSDGLVEAVADPTDVDWFCRSTVAAARVQAARIDPHDLLTCNWRGMSDLIGKIALSVDAYVDRYLAVLRQGVTNYVAEARGLADRESLSLRLAKEASEAARHVSDAILIIEERLSRSTGTSSIQQGQEAVAREAMV